MGCTLDFPSSAHTIHELHALQPQPAARPTEVQRQALNALAACCCPAAKTAAGLSVAAAAAAAAVAAPTTLSSEQLAEALACVVAALSALTSGPGGRSPIEDNVHSRFLATLVHTLNGVIIEVC